MNKDNINKAMKGESYVYQKLLEAGINAKWTVFEKRKAKEDFITDKGVTIDVKIAHPRFVRKHKKLWTFSFHYHDMKQINIDFYVCIAMPNDVLILPSSLISKHLFNISERQLERGKYDYFLENWELIKNFKKENLP